MAGTEHVIKVLEFDSSTKWVACLPLPYYVDNSSGRFETNLKT